MHRDISERVEALFEKEAYLIDVFPKTVPPKDDGRFFAVEKYLQRSRAGFESALARIVIKLYCYYDMSVVTQDNELEAPEPEQLLAVIENGYSKASGFVNILLPECDALLAFSGGDLYMTVYNAPGDVKELISQLARAEGLFFYRAPGI